MNVKGDYVRELREGQGLTREHLAVKAGLTSRTVARVELGEGPVYRGTLVLLAHALGCDVADLTDEDPVAA